MKKFKFLAALLIGGLLSLGVAACAPSDSSTASGGGSTSAIEITGETDPETIQSQQVTQEEWIAAVNAVETATNFSVIGATEMTSGTTVSSFNSERYIEGSKVHAKNTIEGTTSEFYYAEENGAVYMYSYDETQEAWGREVVPVSIAGITTGVSMYATAIENEYAKFSYDSTAKAYVATNVTLTYQGDDQAFDNVTVKFADGKLCYLKLSVEDETTELLYFNVGSTTVTLPGIAA